MPILFGLLRMFGFYTIVHEGTSKVYVLFGNVLDVIKEPGLHFLWFRMGPAALIVNWIGSGYTLDMRMDQVYRRSEPVNSEEGAPMGIGIWYEMFISDPVAYILRQVTSAIKQDGENQVNIITSTAQRQAAIAFAEAAALRPKIVGQALKTIGNSPDILEAMFEILEVQRSLEGGAEITLVPEKSDLISGLIASRSASPAG